MADRSTIEWTDASWTPIRARHKATGKIGWHCTHATPGCVHCYAEGLNKRLGTGLPFKPGHAGEVELFLDEEMLLAPLRWKKPRMIFVCSMTDLFADFVPDEWIDKVFAVMALTPQHTYQVLTKRSARMRAYLSEPHIYDRLSAALGCMLDGDWIWTEGKRHRDAIERMIDVFLGHGTDDAGDIVYHDDPLPLPNVWLGVSAEDQRRADERVPDLLATPAAIRFVSAEPLLGPINFTGIATEATAGRHVNDGMLNALSGAAAWHPTGVDEHGRPFIQRREFAKLDWIIVGGESGREARPMHPDWARQIRDQCAAAGTAFFFKQWGEWAPSPDFQPSVEWSQGSGAGEVAWPDGSISHGHMKERGGAGRMLLHLGKKRAGRLLDGVQHDAMPESR